VAVFNISSKNATFVETSEDQYVVPPSMSNLQALNLSQASLPRNKAVAAPETTEIHVVVLQVLHSFGNLRATSTTGRAREHVNV
jgi:hypothetical protein